MMTSRNLFTWLVLFNLLISGCMADAPKPTPSDGSLGLAFPSQPVPAPWPTSTFEATATPNVPPPSTISSTTTISTSPSPGWTEYVSINDIHDLAFTPDGTLWAISNGGLVHWDLSTDTYTRHLIHARSIAVAPDGTLWLATDYGVCHFDGATCKNYTATDGLIHSGVRVIEVAPDRVVWVGTERGVSRFDGESWQSYPADVPITDLAVAANGEVWVATSLGVGRYLPAQDGWTTYTGEHGLPSGQAQIVAAGPEGDVWTFILWEGMYRFDGTNWQGIDKVNCGTVADIALEADGTPWVATTGGTHYPGGCLSYFDGDTWTEVAGGRGLAPIAAIALGAEGVVAAGTNLGLGVYQGGKWRLLKDGPSYDRATSVAVTPDGAAWFAFGDHSSSTHDPGLSRFDGQSWQYFLDEVEVTALATAPDGSLWAGAGCGVRRFDGVSWETVARCEQDLPIGSILGISFTPDGTAWVANGFSLAQFDGHSWTVYEKLADSLVAAPDGAIWINGWEGLQGSFYVARIDGENWTTFPIADSFPGGFRVDAATADGCVWGITERGLTCFDGQSWTDSQSWTFYPIPDPLSLDGVLILAAAPDGALWLRADNGLARFEVEGASDERWTTYIVEDGLICDRGCGSAIAFAPDGAVWLGTTRFQATQVGDTP
jgi:hypothetical protein